MAQTVDDMALQAGLAAQQRVLARASGDDREGAAPAQPEAARQFVTFGVGAEHYAIDILHVREIDRMVTITRVPDSPPWVEGVINLRGRIIPVMDLARRLGIAPGARGEAGARGEPTRILIVDVARQVLGLVIDRVDGVQRIDAARLEPAPELARGGAGHYVTAVGKLADRLVMVLDPDRLIDDSQVAQLARLNTPA